MRCAVDRGAIDESWERRGSQMCSNALQELISRYEGLKQKHEVYVKERGDDEQFIERFRARESQLMTSLHQLQRIMVGNVHFKGFWCQAAY